MTDDVATYRLGRFGGRLAGECAGHHRASGRIGNSYKGSALVNDWRQVLPCALGAFLPVGYASSQPSRQTAISPRTWSRTGIWWMRCQAK